MKLFTTVVGLILGCGLLCLGSILTVTGYTITSNINSQNIIDEARETSGEVIINFIDSYISILGLIGLMGLYFVGIMLITTGFFVIRFVV